MSTEKYTPTPWKADGSDICQNNNDHFHVIARAKLFRDFDRIDIHNKQTSPDRHQHLVEMCCPVEGSEDANAAFICRAVNNHDALAGALAEIERGMGAYDRDPLIHAENVINDMKAIARDALASMKEQRP